MEMDQVGRGDPAGRAELPVGPAELLVDRAGRGGRVEMAKVLEGPVDRDTHTIRMEQTGAAAILMGGQISESVTPVYSPAHRHISADGGYFAGWLRRVPATSGFQLFRKSITRRFRS